MPKVSVIIPAYNAMEYLPETLGSVLNQSFQDLEVIIIDDGSVDHIGEWAKSISDSRVRIFHQKNQGPSAARNIGIKKAEGEYVAFLDADDLWEPTKIETQVFALDKNHAVGLVYTWISSIDKNGVSTGRAIRNCDEGDVWESLLLHNFIECGSTPMVRRDCFETVGVFDEGLKSNQDFDLWIRISCCYKFAVIKEVLTQYRKHGSSHSKNWKSSEKCMFMVLERALKDPPIALTDKELERLRRDSYGRASLNLAWQPVQSNFRDYKTSTQYLSLATQYSPKLCLSKEYLRLSTAIFVIRILGPGGYEKFLAAFYFLRRKILNPT
jgi:glycosyltransferase involved in cell wall biosynthesis